MHMAGLDRRLFPGLAEGIGRARHDQHRLHAERARHDQVLLDILEHRRPAGIDAVFGEKILVGRALGLRGEAGIDDVENVLEVMEDAELAGDVLGMAARAIGQDQLTAGQCRDRRPERWVGIEQGQVDLMGEVEEVSGVDAVFLHQPLQRRAVALVIIFLQRPRRHAVEAEQLRQEERDALVDLRPDLRLMRIERVVEVEDPMVDMAESVHVGQEWQVGGDVSVLFHWIMSCGT